MKGKIIPVPNRQIEGPILLKGDKVFFLCTNPAIGEVYRMAHDLQWVDVKWYEGSCTRSGRYKREHLGLLNSLCNKYMSEWRSTKGNKNAF